MWKKWTSNIGPVHNDPKLVSFIVHFIWESHTSNELWHRHCHLFDAFFFFRNQKDVSFVDTESIYCSSGYSSPLLWILWNTGWFDMFVNKCQIETVARLEWRLGGAKLLIWFLAMMLRKKFARAWIPNAPFLSMYTKYISTQWAKIRKMCNVPNST